MLAVSATVLTLAIAAWIAWRPAGSPSVVVDIPATMASPPADAAGTPARAVAKRDEPGGGQAGQAVEVARAAAGNATPHGRPDGGAAPGAGPGQRNSDEPIAAELGREQAGLDAAIAAERARGGPYEEPAATAAEDGGGEIAEEPFIEVPLVVTRGSNLRTEPTVASPRLMWVARGSGALLLDPEPVHGYYKVATGEREGWIWHINVEPADVTPPDDEQLGEAPAADTEPTGEPSPDQPLPAPKPPRRPKPGRSPAAEAPAPAKAPGAAPDAATGSEQPAAPAPMARNGKPRRGKRAAAAAA